MANGNHGIYGNQVRLYSYNPHNSIKLRACLLVHGFVVDRLQPLDLSNIADTLSIVTRPVMVKVKSKVTDKDGKEKEIMVDKEVQMQDDAHRISIEPLKDHWRGGRFIHFQREQAHMLWKS